MIGKQGVRLTQGRVISVFCLFALIVYLPALLFEFGLHNDYLRWDYAKSDFFGFSESVQLVVIGRPLNALVINIVFYFIGSIKDFAAVRIATFVLTLASSLIFFKYFSSRLHVGLFLSAAIAFGIQTLPATQSYILWATLFGTGLSVLLSLISYLVLDGVRISDTFGKKSVRMGSALFLYIASIMIYPLAALALLIFPFSKALFSESHTWAETRKSIVRDIVFSVFGQAAYYLAHKFIILPFLVKQYESVNEKFQYVMEHPKYSMTLTTDIADKVHQFIKITGIAVSGVWHFLFGSEAAVIVIVFFVLGAAYIFYKEVKSFKGPLERKAAAWRGVQRGILAFALIILACSPMLAAQPSWVHYRMTFAYAAMAVVALFWVFERLGFHLGPVPGRISQAVMVTFVAAIGVISFRNVMDTSHNANKELAFVRQKLASVDDISRIKFFKMITIPWGSTYIEKDLKYEFGYSAANFNPINSIIGAALKDTGMKLKMIAFETLQLGRAKEKYLDENTLVLDMNEARLKGGNYKDEILSIVVSTSDRGTNPVRVFGGGWPWQTTGYPQWVRVDYPERKLVGTYAFLCKTLENIPLKWELQSSEDGLSWVILDRQDVRSEEAYTVKGVNVPKGWRLLSSDDRGEHWVTADGLYSEKEGRIYALDRTMTLDKTVSYKTYRVLFINGNGDTLKLDGLQLFEGDR